MINQGLAAAKKQRSMSEIIVPQVGSKENDKISALPGQPIGISFAQYSGYVTVDADADAGIAMFYYLAESSNDPTTKPLVLWLNGGPGFSSLGAGAMMELGPFRVNNDGKTLWLNQFAWNNVANILFLESPAGVGFSYSNTSSDSGDEKTRRDSFIFLLNWMERFPEYKHRDFYIVGESYAGHYVPQLAQLILSHRKTEPNLVINLEGIATGNALLDKESMQSGSYDFYWTHALISDEIHDGIVLNCNFSAETTSEACNEYVDQARSSQGNIYEYDIYAPLCKPNANTSLPICGFDPCSDNYVYSYLNSAEVQKVLNVRGIPYSWAPCTSEEYHIPGLLAILRYTWVGKTPQKLFYRSFKSSCKVELGFGYIAEISTKFCL